MCIGQSFLVDQMDNEIPQMRSLYLRDFMMSAIKREAMHIMRELRSLDDRIQSVTGSFAAGREAKVPENLNILRP